MKQNIAMPMYNLIEYSDNYSDTSGSLWQFKTDTIEGAVDLTVDGNHNPNNLSSFKYKSSPTANRRSFWRSLEMSLINCKVELSLSWDPNCVLTNLVGDSAFTITDAKLYVPIVTLSMEDNAKLSKLLNKGFKKPVCWNKYKIIPKKTYNKNDYIRELLDASCQGVKRLFVLAYRDCGGANRVPPDSHKRYFLPRVKNKNYNIETDGTHFYDQSINDLIKQDVEVREVSTRQGNDYTNGWLLLISQTIQD